MIEAQDAQPRARLLFIHGFLGRGNNGVVLAQKIVDRRPDLSVLLLDVRLHGDSLRPPPPHTLATAADDIAALHRTLAPLPAAAVVGHSLGGKVALSLLQQNFPAERFLILDVWPGPRIWGSGYLPERALSLMVAHPGPFALRKSAIDALTDGGLKAHVAQWLAMNLKHGEGGLIWALDPEGLSRLLQDHYAVDHRPLCADQEGLRFLLGGRSTAVSPSERDWLRGACGTESVGELDGAGHWLHWEAPEAVAHWICAQLLDHP